MQTDSGADFAAVHSVFTAQRAANDRGRLSRRDLVSNAARAMVGTTNVRRGL